PFDDASSLVRVWMRSESPDGAAQAGLTAADLRDLRAEPGLFAALAGWRSAEPTYVGLADERPLKAAEITADLFPGVLRVQPFLGRTFLPEEDRPGSPPVTVLSHRFWGDELGGDPTIIGRSLVLDGESFVVVGVMPPDFRTPFMSEAELWMPARLELERCRAGCPTLSAVGRLAGGTTVPVARDRATVVARRLAESYPGTNRGVVPELGPLRDSAAGMSAETTGLLQTAGVLVLLIASFNVAILLLARGLDRAREMRVRHAVGASRSQLVRQLMGETLVLAAVGSLVGVGIGIWSLEALAAVAPPDVVPAAELDGGILLAVAGLTGAMGLLSGIAPSLAGAGSPLSGAPGGRDAPLRRTIPTFGAPGLNTVPRRSWRSGFGSVLGVLQLAITTVLLVGAGGLLQDLHSATHDGLGFDHSGVLTVEADLTSGGHRTEPDRLDRLAALVERLEEVPGVFSVGATDALPFDEAREPVRILVQDDGGASFRAETRLKVRAVSSAYFYTLGQRLMEGRGFRADDDAVSEPVAILNQAGVRALVSDPARSPLGARVAAEAGPSGPDRIGPAPHWRTVVGVVADDREDSEHRSAEPLLYVPVTQAVPATVWLLARVDSDPASMGAPIRQALSEVEGTFRAAEVEPFGSKVAEAYAAERFGAILAGASAMLALLLSLIGLFGILAHAVLGSLGELGLRRVLGATEEDLRRRIVLRSAALAAGGVCLGLAGAWYLAQGPDAAFVGEGVRSPFVYALAVSVLGVAAMGAGVWPARRAVADETLMAIRAER
ncbi:MAG: FtsX-like permease family protein, partial [Longimicrobiales bacterium]|nr:FtsX-like permease family protein [Longimicrobiales bacterium]